jgi:hypothetical protein
VGSCGQGLCGVHLREPLLTFEALWSLGTLSDKILRSTHTVYLCILSGSENKQRLFPYTALTDWFYNRDGVCLLRGKK